jgi:hypothetical protein
VEALIMRASREVGLLLVVAAAALLAAVPVIVWRGRRTGLRRAAWTTVLEAAIIGSTVLIATLTLGAFGGGGRGQVNPMLANVALYVPLGIAVGLRSPDLRLVSWALAVGGSTVAIEAAQWL